jgi:hypothetical protein
MEFVGKNLKSSMYMANVSTSSHTKLLIFYAYTDTSHTLLILQSHFFNLFLIFLEV